MIGAIRYEEPMPPSWSFGANRVFSADKPNFKLTKIELIDDDIIRKTYIHELFDLVAN